ncbi:MAG: hypothetical protein WEA09_07920 [Gemmatimonadota bacterium]
MVCSLPGRLLLGLVLFPSVACWGEDLAGPAALPALEVSIVAGGEQWVEPFRALPQRMEVLVRHVPSGLPARGVPVKWSLEAGSGVLQEAGVSTDSLGMAWARLQLGEGEGERWVVADVDGRAGEPARFRIEGAWPPEPSFPDGQVLQAGSEVWVQVDNPGPSPEELRLTFSGVPAPALGVREASSGAREVRVKVPPCLTEGHAEVRALRRRLLGPGVSVGVKGDGGPLLRLNVGEHTVVNDPSGTHCLRLPPGARTDYLAVVQITSPWANRRFGLTLTGVSGGESPLAGGGGSAPTASEELQWQSVGTGAWPGGGVDAWKPQLRALEEEALVASRVASASVDPPPRQNISKGLPDLPVFRSGGEAEVPEPGSVREFRILDRELGFRTLEARAEVVGGRAIVYQDLDAPAGGFTIQQMEAFASEFDDAIYPVVTQAFGSPSNLNGHGRVVILLTPQVNRLTPRGSDSFVGGFFFGLDLLRGRTGSNEGEIFYALVPDPDAEFGDPRDAVLVSRVLPAILAHEFQHMIHFNQRVLLGGALVPEALWLSEGLAQVAEDLMGEEHRRRGNLQLAQRYEEGNWLRASRFLGAPTSGALLAFQGGGSIVERGAGWLFLRYLQGQAHDMSHHDLLVALTRATLGGVANVENTMGRGWAQLFSGWSGALYLDGLGVNVDPGFRFPGTSLRDGVGAVSGVFPLRPNVVGSRNYQARGTLPSGGVFFVRVAPQGEHGFSLNLSGLDGAQPDPDAGLQLLLVRLR